jgi:hypothetical protein
MFKVFQMFPSMLQVFHMNVAKVDRDVAYVAMVVHICCKLMFPMFIFFQTYVASVFILNVVYVSCLCCKYFIWMFTYVFCNGFKCF